MRQKEHMRLINLPRHARADGEVVVVEAAAQVPFQIERMFVLAAPAAPNAASTRIGCARNS